MKSVDFASSIQHFKRKTTIHPPDGIIHQFERQKNNIKVCKIKCFIPKRKDAICVSIAKILQKVLYKSIYGAMMTLVAARHKNTKTQDTSQRFIINITNLRYFSVTFGVTVNKTLEMHLNRFLFGFVIKSAQAEPKTIDNTPSK